MKKILIIFLFILVSNFIYASPVGTVMLIDCHSNHIRVLKNLNKFDYSNVYNIYIDPKRLARLRRLKDGTLLILKHFEIIPIIIKQENCCCE